MLQYIHLLVVVFSGVDNDLSLVYNSDMECGKELTAIHEVFEGKDPEYEMSMCVPTTIMSQVPVPKLRPEEKK